MEGIVMGKKVIATILIGILTLVLLLNQTISIQSVKNVQIGENNSALAKYDLTFETYPGRCRVTVWFAGSHYTSSGNPGTYTFKDLNPTFYIYRVTKSGYYPEFGCFYLTTDTKVIEALNKI